MINPKVLENIGLSQNETKVYLTLIRLGSASVAQITKKADVHRSNVYDTLERLMEKGLVSAVLESEKKFYEAAHPDTLMNILKEKEKGLTEQMPQLIGEYELVKKKQEIHHFKGRGGIKTVLMDVNKYKEYLAFGISENLGSIVPYYFPHWVRERLEKGLFAKMITSEDDVLKTPSVVGYKNYLRLFEVRCLSREFKTPSTTWLYGDKIAIILETEMPLAVVIESKEINLGYKKYFKMLWDIAQPEDKSKYKQWMD